MDYVLFSAHTNTVDDAREEQCIFAFIYGYCAPTTKTILINELIKVSDR